MKNKIYRVVTDSPFSFKRTLSYGLIVISKKTKRMVAVQRKHSAEFLAILTGVYSSGSLPFLLSSITQQEADILTSLIKTDREQFLSIFIELKIFHYDADYVWDLWLHNQERIKYFLDNIKFTDNNLSWCWPKGRPNNEIPFECAKREFWEEVQVRLPPYIHRDNKAPTQIFKTVTGRQIESKFFIYLIEDEFDIPPADNHPEVNDRNWFTLDQCKFIFDYFSDQLYNYLKRHYLTTDLNFNPLH